MFHLVFQIPILLSVFFIFLFLFYRLPPFFLRRQFHSRQL